jgi:hypothetical protein
MIHDWKRLAERRGGLQKRPAHESLEPVPSREPPRLARSERQELVDERKRVIPNYRDRPLVRPSCVCREAKQLWSPISRR